MQCTESFAYKEYFFKKVEDSGISSLVKIVRTFIVHRVMERYAFGMFVLAKNHKNLLIQDSKKFLKQVCL
jgi:hypothetical protein